MTKAQKEGCVWMSVGVFLGFLFLTYVTVRVIHLAWRG